jgi:hypothetical protein
MLELNQWLGQAVIALIFLLLAVVLIGALLKVSLLICEGATIQLNIVFFMCNAFMLALIWYGSYLHHQMMVLSQHPFDWHSFFKIGLILGAPCLINAFTALWALSKELSAVRIPSP